MPGSLSRKKAAAATLVSDIEPPDFLGPVARDEFLRLSSALRELRLLTSGDVGLLIMACAAFDVAMTAYADLSRPGPSEDVGRGGKSKKTNSRQAIDFFKAAGFYLGAIQSLGLTGLGRVRLGISSQAESDDSDFKVGDLSI